MLLGVAVFWKVFASILLLLVCFLLIVVVLLQKGRGGGLAGAFGGAGGHSAFGAKTGDFFTWLTVCLAGLFLLLAVMNNFIFRKVTVSTPAIAQPTSASPGEGARPMPESDAGEGAPSPAGAPVEAKPPTAAPAVPAAPVVPPSGQAPQMPQPPK